MSTNCLQGLRCPKCWHEEEILVKASMWVSVQDDGTDPFADSTKNRGGTEYDYGSEAACPECKYEGKLADWDIASQPKKRAKKRGKRKV